MQLNHHFAGESLNNVEDQDLAGVIEVESSIGPRGQDGGMHAIQRRILPLQGAIQDLGLPKIQELHDVQPGLPVTQQISLVDGVVVVIVQRRASCRPFPY